MIQQEVSCRSPLGFKVVLWWAVVLVLTGLCGGPAGAEHRDVTVMVASNGWHTGLVITRADLRTDAIPEFSDFAPEFAWFEIGWGDAEYYPARDPSLGMALRAMIDGPAVMHVAALRAPHEQVFPTAERVRLRFTRTAFESLVSFVSASFGRDGRGRAASSGPGLYPFSLFYPATGTFNAFNTCNTWTARALESAGVPLPAGGIQRAEDLMSRIRRLTAAPGGG